MLETLSDCPYCRSSVIAPFIKAIDYTVSRETFTICQCNSCSLLFTNPRPDQASIGTYYQSEDYISHTNSQKGLINKVYQQARKLALKKKLNLIREYSVSGNLLDIGCGTGEFLGLCQQNGFKCVGIEPDSQARELAKTNHSLEVRPPEYLQSLEPESFDIITMWHVLEHVPDITKSIQQLKSLVKKNGHCLIAVPNPESHDARHYQQGWAAYDVPRHLFHYKPSFIKTAFSTNGFTFVKAIPMTMDAYYVSLLSEKYQAGGVGLGVLFKAIYNGFRSNLKAKNPLEYSSVIYVFKSA